MEQHPDLAVGFAKGDKVCHEQLWAELTTKLNASGPPIRELVLWKKTWTDWKLHIKRRLAHNKHENSKTGGGRFNQYVLTPVEEQIAVLCSLHRPVDGIPKTKSFGVPNNGNKETNDGPYLPTKPNSSFTAVERLLLASDSTDDITLNSFAAVQPTIENPPPDIPLSPTLSPALSQYPTTPRRKRATTDVLDVVELERENFKVLSGKIDGIAKEMKGMTKSLKDIRRLEEKKYKEMCRHNYALEKSNQTKNELKLQFLELEKMKLGILPD